MSQTKARAEFYEKMYFHEIEARNVLYERVNIPLAVLIAFAGVLGFMLQNLERDLSTAAANAFYCTFGISCFFFGIAAYYLKGAASGHQYEFVAAADEWEGIREQCMQLYKDYDNKAELVEDGVAQRIGDEYVRCATINAKVNDGRSYCLFLTIKFLIISAVFVLLAFLCYFFGGLDKSLHEKPKEVTVVKPVELKGFNMTTSKPAPPPPPPAPPSRIVREDKRPSPPPPPPRPQQR